MAIRMTVFALKTSSLVEILHVKKTIENLNLFGLFRRLKKTKNKEYI